MKAKRLILVLISIVLFVAIGWFSLTENRNLPIVNKTVAVSTIRIIAGHEFDITLENGKRIHGVLEATTPTGPGSNVAKKVADLINTSSNPKVKLIGKEKDSDIWRVELYLTRQGREIKLSQWLKDNKLLWE